VKGERMVRGVVALKPERRLHVRKSLIAVLAVAAFGLAADPASAKTFSIGHVSASSLFASCSKAGGTFYGGENASFYGCKKACGKKGQTCSVECDTENKTCEGSTPTRVTGGRGLIVIMTNPRGLVAAPPKPRGVFGTGILDNGPGLGSQGPAAAGSVVTTPAAPPPSAPPVIIH
jgi:hypothetical protein